MSSVFCPASLRLGRQVLLYFEHFKEKTMRKAFLPFVVLTLTLALQPTFAAAYIGPGVGAGAIGAVIGVVGSIFLAIFAVVWYPVKRMMKGRKKSASANNKTQTK